MPIAPEGAIACLSMLRCSIRHMIDIDQALLEIPADPANTRKVSLVILDARELALFLATLSYGINGRSFLGIGEYS